MRDQIYEKMQTKGKMKRGYGAILSALVVCFLASGCGNNTFAGNKMTVETTENTILQTNTESSEMSYSKDIFAMDTYMTLTAYGDRSEEAVEAGAARITELENLVSTGIETSEVAKLNDTGSGEVSDETAYMIKKALEIGNDTQGAFDLTVYPLMVEWGFTTGEFQVPDAAVISDKLQYVNNAFVTLDEENGQVTLQPGTQIDLGGIAKGYTSGEVMRIMQEYGIESAVISLGGNVQTLGTKTTGEKWRVAVENPEDTSSYVGILSVADRAVITSGGYERYFEEGGVKYHHILDASTGYPAESGILSVTIISEDGTLADGLSTALFVMGKDKAFAYWQEHQEEFDFIIEDSEQQLYASAGIADDFESEKEVIVVK